jgi:hypothetical protein
MLLNYSPSICADADRLVCNPGYDRATIHSERINPSDAWIIELIVHVAGFHHDRPPIRHHPTTHRIKSKTSEAKGPIAAGL